MNRVFHSLLRRVPIKVTVTHPRKQRKFVWRSVAARRIAFFVLSVACGLLLAHTNLVPKSPNQNPATTANVATQDTAVSDASSGPKQTNNLFSTSPSWAQNFAGQTSGQLNSKYWNTLVGPAQNANNEQQYYNASSSNIRIENGALRLIGTHQTEPDGYQYGSARIETQGKKSFLYGRIDVEAKLPAGVGTWPAIWLLPDNDTYAQKSPANYILRYKNGGEIDILEAVGFQPNVIYGIAHTASDTYDHTDGTGSFSTIGVPNSNSSFNKYSILWTPTSLTFEVNDQPYFTYTRQNGADYKTWPFDQPFYLIANLALGGSWGGLDTADFPATKGINNGALPASLDIRSIYYYSYVGK